MSEFDPRLDFQPYKDPRSRDFPAVTPRLAAAAPRSYTWRIVKAPVLDQGREGACTGFGMAAELAARPFEVDITNGTGSAREANSYAQRVYWTAQGIDRAEGRHYRDGATMLAAAKALVKTGKVSAYRWAFGLDDVVAVLGRRGPVILGVNWYESMYDADDGVVKVGGRVVGGHCLLARGVDVRRQRILWRNSWGPDYGRGGDAWISFADMDRLLREDGEAVIPTARQL